MAAMAHAAKGTLDARRCPRTFSKIMRPTRVRAEDTSRRLDDWRKLPVQPWGNKATIVDEVVRNQVYVLEQQLGVFDVAVNIRMTALVIDGGIALVNTLAPTQECLSFVQELEEKHGAIKYIILPTTQLEHKIYLKSFSDTFPDANIWVTDKQWSFPPFAELVGYFPSKIDGYLSSENDKYPWKDDLDIRVLDINLPGSIPTPFQEAAIFHRSSESLVVTDAVVRVGRDPPKIVKEDPTSLLTIAGVWPSEGGGADRDSRDASVNTPNNQRLGWAKTALLALFLSPEAVSKDLGEYLSKGFVWADGWESTFEAVNSRELLVSPLVSELVFRPQASKVWNWVQDVTKWKFKRVIPSHFDIATRAGPEEFRNAFRFLAGEDEQEIPKEKAPWEEFISSITQRKEKEAEILEKTSDGYITSIPGTSQGDFEVLRFIAKSAFGDKALEK